MGHLARIIWSEWSWKGTCKRRQLDRQTTQRINFDMRGHLKYNKVLIAKVQTNIYRGRLCFPGNSFRHKCLFLLFFFPFYFSIFSLEPRKGSKVHSYFHSSWNESFHSISLLFLMHIILYVLLSLNWEGEHTIAILRKGGGRKRFKVYLTFSTGFFAEYFL